MRRWFAAGLAVAAVIGATAIAASQEVKSLRGDQAITEVDKAPPVHQVREGQRYERAYRQQPPLIPHAIEKYEIDVKVNQCLRCHDWPQNVRENAPKVSETHYVDRQGVRLDKIASTRWFCNQCHVPQADAKPLVENTFKPASPATR
ncbi:MAG: nitrate reductase cytochrome c-type subunit [Alphaproteobacteria bacterium]|nr:nitrate reductase cytochrome c-type subunit [Alphaproteobacteria bacterium]